MAGRRPRRAREVTKQETREALIDAAFAEFAAHGLDAPSLDAICARAGYTRGAFYVHFRDREQLMAAVVERVIGGFLTATIARGEEARELEQTIERFADAVARTIAGASGRDALVLPVPAGVPFARLLEAITRSAELRGRFRMLLEGAIAAVAEVAAHGQRAGAVRADVAAMDSATLLVLIALGVLVALDAGVALDPSALKRAVLTLLRRRDGSAPPPRPQSSTANRRRRFRAPRR